MASPHVAGAAALFLQAHPGTKAADLRAVLQNTAAPHNFSTSPFVDATHHQGAGMLQIPNILVHLNHQSRISQMEIFDAATDRAWHRLDDVTDVVRNSTATGFFGFPFSGVSFVGDGKKSVQVPNGTYVAKISVLKALGDENNPAGWETVTSPTFKITR